MGDQTSMEGQVRALLAFDQNFRFDDEDIAWLETTFPQVDFISADVREMEDVSGPVDLAMGWLPYDLLDLPGLKWVQLPSVGIDRYLRIGPLPDGLVVTNARGVFGVPGAEHAIALTFALARQIHIHVRQTERREWKRNPVSIEVHGSKVLVVGLGDIGTEIARCFHALGANVSAVRRTRAEAPPFVDSVHPPSELVSVVGDADIVILALPGTTSTRGLFDRSCIDALQPGVLLVNVGRGDTVDEEALVEALKTGRLGGVGLDVTSVEPLPSDSPLWGFDNVIITSHSMGMTPHKTLRRRELFAENLGRFLQGETLVNVVDPELGY